MVVVGGWWLVVGLLVVGLVVCLFVSLFVCLFVWLVGRLVVWLVILRFACLLDGPAVRDEESPKQQPNDRLHTT